MRFVAVLISGLIAGTSPTTTQAQSTCDEVDLGDYGSVEEWTFDYEDCLERALKRNPRDADAYWRRGEIHAGFGELDGALDDFTKAIELNPERSIFYRSRGDAYQAAGKPKLAIRDYSKALEFDPSDFRARTSRARAYAKIGEKANAKSDYDDVIASFTETIETNPQNQWAFYYRGLAYKELGEDDRAVADLEKALSIDPNLKEAASALVKLRGPVDLEDSEPARN